jgi:hypothetical protein
MDISRDDAAQALSDIASARGRSHLLAGYDAAGPILILWGVIWVVVYTGMGILPPQQWAYLWIPGDIIGMVVTLLMIRRPKSPVGAGPIWRVFGGMTLASIFCVALFAMIRVTDVKVYMAVPGLISGTIYAAMGLWRMMRYLWVGIVVIAASLIGFFAFPSILPFWMAATGGGGLIVAGLLFRRA